MPTSAQVRDRLLSGWAAAGRRKLLQAAADGRWEAARGVELPIDADAARSLVRDAGPAGADVAVEFEWLGHPLVFVGVRRTPADAAGAFERDVVRLVEDDPDDPLGALTLLAGGEPHGVEHVELGAANAWRSVGPLRLWTRGEGRTPGAVRHRLHEHPALARCHVPVALEVAFDLPRPCWLGIEVSTPSRGGHVVAAAVVEGALARLLGPA